MGNRISQFLPSMQGIIDEQVRLYREPREILTQTYIPDTAKIPSRLPSRWLKIPDLVCVFVDMKGSTQLSASLHDRSTAGAYQLFTGTAVRLFDEFEAPYIDVRGDGVFALFNSNQVYRAFAAAITFKTFASEEFVPLLSKKTKLELGAHIGIDQKTALVRKIGMLRHGGRTDRQNEVWAGKPINMASKLAARGQAGELLVSDRYFNRITSDYVRLSCGCPNGEAAELWQMEDLTEDVNFDFDTAWVLKSNWCEDHGKEFCEAILACDQP